MFVIGERINGMFRTIGDAIAAKDPKPVQEMALPQLAAGASALDINVGTRVPKAERGDVMEWLVKVVREVTDAPLVIDNPSIDTIRRGLVLASKGGKAVINSTTGQEDKLTAFMALAKECEAGIICLAIDENGVAATAEGKAEIGMRCPRRRHGGRRAHRGHLHRPHRPAGELRPEIARDRPADHHPDQAAVRPCAPRRRGPEQPEPGRQGAQPAQQHLRGDGHSLRHGRQHPRPAGRGADERRVHGRSC